MAASRLFFVPSRTRALTLTLAVAHTLAIVAMTHPISAADWHVAISGNDTQPGTADAPLRTIQAAALRAQPGDVITVHAGVYRERVNPPRGGESDTRRITYQAAPGERVEIKGSEVVKGWAKVQDDVWKVSLPNPFFGKFNPFQDSIRGDWFDPKGRPHHTGAVYLDGDWLTEATRLDEVLLPPGTSPAWLTNPDPGSGYLLNVAWFQPGAADSPAGRVSASRFASQQGVQTAPSTEGVDCLGWIEHGDWVRYEKVDFAARTDNLIIRAASATEGGLIEVRLNSPDGELLGSCAVPNTGDWQAWSTFTAPLRRPLSGTHPVCLVFRRASSPNAPARPLNSQLWFAEVDATNTTLWAQFRGVNPNERTVEINVRQTVFYPDQPGRDFITVRGFILRHAATPWAPPTAEQIGLLGTHWSKGWIIESNVVSHSICSGIALGKHGDEFDNTSANTAEGYVKTIERALRRGWNRDTIGHHVVRNNTISHCEQAGIVGSLGAAFSTVVDNTIHDIHVRRLFTGAEMAGIKFHAAIDTVIRGNHIHHTCLGLWLDWMAQGTRVSRNVFHHNAGQDLFVEVNHGPFVVDNNLFLSPVSLLDMSQGGAYLHNLFAGKIISRPEPSRETPYHPPHTTTVAGLSSIKGGDNRFFNNLFLGLEPKAPEPSKEGGKDPEWRGGLGLWVYDFRERPLMTGGNVYAPGARPHARESDALVANAADAPAVRLIQESGSFVLEFTPGRSLAQARTAPVTTARLGKAQVPDLPYENADGSTLAIDTDFFGKPRGPRIPIAGPFEVNDAGTRRWTLR